MPAWLIVLAEVALALPFGWGLGVLAAWLVARSSFGQLPAVTVPLGILAALVFACWPTLPPRIRFGVMVAGVIAFVALGRSTA